MSQRKKPYESLYRRLERKARNRGIICNLSYEEFVEFTKIKKCHYCLQDIVFSEYNITKNGYSCNLDRKNNDGPYSKDNCVVCCKKCNFGKGSRHSYTSWMTITEQYR